jgi:hypothetical protein
MNDASEVGTACSLLYVLYMWTVVQKIFDCTYFICELLFRKSPWWKHRGRVPGLAWREHVSGSCQVKKQLQNVGIRISLEDRAFLLSWAWAAWLHATPHVGSCKKSHYLPHKEDYCEEKNVVIMNVRQPQPRLLYLFLNSSKKFLTSDKMAWKNPRSSKRTTIPSAGNEHSP